MFATAKRNTIITMDALRWPIDNRVRWVAQAISLTPTLSGWDLAGFPIYDIRPVDNFALSKSFVLGPVDYPEGASFSAEDVQNRVWHHKKDWPTNLKAKNADHAGFFQRTSLLIHHLTSSGAIPTGRGEILKLLEQEFVAFPYRMFFDYSPGNYQGISRLWIDFARPHAANEVQLLTRYLCERLNSKLTPFYSFEPQTLGWMTPLPHCWANYRRQHVQEIIT